MTRGDVLLIHLPNVDKREITSDHPAIALQTNGDNHQPLLMIAPLTSNPKTARFRYTMKIEPSSENGLSVPSVCMVFQTWVIDRVRIIKRIGKVSYSDMGNIDCELEAMLGL